MLNFECPKCKNKNYIEEVMDNVTISYQIIFLDDNTLDYSLGEPKTFGGCIDRYQCGNCGYVLKGIISIEELEEYLKGENK